MIHITDPTLPSPVEEFGVRFRHFRSVDLDIAGMVAANQAARLADGEIEPIDVDSMRTRYEHLERSDPATDILIVERSGEIAGYARVEWDDTSDGERWYDSICLLHPDLRRRGIGSAILSWTEARRAEIAAGHRAAGNGLDRPWLLTSFVYDGDAGAGPLLRGRGYEPFRRFFSMVRPDLEGIPDVAMPPGLEVRDIEPEPAMLRRIFDADVEAFRDHFGWIDDSETAYDEFVSDSTRDPSLWMVAFDGAEIAGAVMPVLRTGIDGAVEGWLDPVFTRRPWRRRGLARALIARSLVRLRERGAARSCLGVDSENPNAALTLYESCGFRVASSSTGYRRPLDAGSPGVSAPAAEARR